MSIVMEINPFEFFTDTNGDALDSGYVWIGQPNLDPRQYPATAFYDEALTIPAAMPLRTSNGYIVRNGSPTFLWINGSYSILVQDKKGRQVFYVPDFLMIGAGQPVTLADLSSSDPAKGAALIGYKQNAPSSIPRTLRDKAIETVSAAEFGIVPGADSTTTITKINTALQELQDSTGTNKELKFLDLSDWYNINSPIIMRNGVSLSGPEGKQARIKNTRTSFDFFLSSVLLPGNFHPDFTEALVYQSFGTVAAAQSVVTLTGGGISGFAVGDPVVIASDAFFLTGGFKCPQYMYLNEIVGISGNSIKLKYAIEFSFAGGICVLDGSQPGRNGVPLFFWQNGKFRNFECYTDGRFHGDTATLNCLFENVHVRARSFIYGNTFQRTKWKDISGLIGSGNEHSLCCLDSLVDGFEFTRDPDSQASSNSAFFGFQENTRNFKYTNGTVATGDYTSSTALVNFINCQDCGLDGNVRIWTGSNWTGSDISFATVTEVGRIPCQFNIVRESTFNGQSRFRNIDFNGDGISEVIKNNVVSDTVFTGAVSSECIRYVGTVNTNTVKRCNFPDGRPLLNVNSNSLELVENHIADGFNSSADPDIYTRNIIRSNKTIFFADRLAAIRSSLGSLSQSGTTPLNLIDARMFTSMTNKDTFDFEIRGSISGTANVKTIEVSLFNHTDSVSIPLVQKDFLAATTGAFVITGNIYFANLSLYTTTMDVATITGSTREMIQSAITTNLSAKDVSIRIIASCVSAADGMTFQRFKSNLTNPMLI